MSPTDSIGYWLVAGLVLLISEMLTAGFFLVFIALGCFAAALVAFFNDTLWIQMVTCAVISLVGVISLRKPIQRRLLKTITLSADVGKEIRVDEEIAPHQQTRISYQGASWLATNLGTEKIQEGNRVIIVGIDGNVLLLRKIE